MTDEAKAVEEVAKLGQRSLETAEKAGGWADRVFGGGFNQLGAAFEESMMGYRMRNRIKVIEKTQKAIAAAGLEGRTRPLDERIALPLLDAISNESDDGIQDVWASYLSNATDPSKSRPDRILIDVIRQLDPLDLPVLKVLIKSTNRVIQVEEFHISKENLRECLDRLNVIGLFDFDNPDAVYIVASDHNDKRITVKVEENAYYGTRLLNKFLDVVEI